MSENLSKQAAQILSRIQYATLATASKTGKPWNSPVAYVYDDELNLYWFSDKQSQHSQNVRENNNVFIVVYDSTVPEGQGRGLYIEAQALEVDDPDEVIKARKIKKGDHHTANPQEFLSDAGRRVYRAIPQNVWINDAEIKDGVFIRDYKVKVSLEMINGIIHTSK